MHQTERVRLIFKERFMNTYYAKTILFAYPNIEAVIEQIDDIVMRKALSSRCDYSACQAQCEEICRLTETKVRMLELIEHVNTVLATLTQYETDLLDYKYFHIQPKEYFDEIGFIAEGRTYFRHQTAIINKVAKRLEHFGVTDEWYTKNFSCVRFFSELLKRVILRDECFKWAKREKKKREKNK